MQNSYSPRRVFVGIKLDPQIAQECLKIQAALGDLSARFIAPEDLHLTLLPPWIMVDQSLVEEMIRDAVADVSQFTLTLERVDYGPTPMRPRLVWAQAAAVPEIISLEKALAEVFAVQSRTSFLPHVTLARFPKDTNVNPAHRPVERPISLSMPVVDIALFASKNGNGSGYEVLSTLPLAVGSGIPH